MAWPNCSRFCSSSGCCWWLSIIQEDGDTDPLSKKGGEEENGWWVYVICDSEHFSTNPAPLRDRDGPFCNWVTAAFCSNCNSSWLLALWSLVISKAYEDALVFSVSWFFSMPFCGVFLAGESDVVPGWGFLLRRLWSANRFLQLLFTSSNSAKAWNLLHCWQKRCSIPPARRTLVALEWNSQTLCLLW